MREIALLVAGLVVVAALPLQEQKYPSVQSEIHNIILNADPEENYLRAVDERDSPTSTETKKQITLTEEPPQHSPQEQSSLPPHPPQGEPQPPQPPQEEQQPSPPPHKEPQPPQEEPEPSHPPQEEPELPQEEPQLSHPPQEEPELSQEEPEPSQEELKSEEQGTLQEQSQLQDSNKDSNLDAEEVWEETQPFLVHAQEDFSYDSDNSKGGEFSYDVEVEAFPGQLDGGFIALQTKDAPLDDVFMHDLKTGTFTQEEEQFSPDPDEPQGEYFPYDFNEEFHFEPKIDFSTSDYEELPTKLISAHLQKDSFPYNSEDLFPFDEGSIDSDYEQPSEIEEEPFLTDYYGFPMEGDQPDYDYEFNVEEDQPQWKEEVISVHEENPNGELHPVSDDDTMDLFSWLVPDFMYKDHTYYDVPPYVTGYNDVVSHVDSSANTVDMQIEYQALVEQPNTDSEELYTSEDVDDTVNFEDSFPEEQKIEMEPPLYRVTKDAAGDVSLADFYIPTNDEPVYDDVPYEYLEDERLGDGEAHEEENLLVDDGFFHTNPALGIHAFNVENDQPDMKGVNDDILFGNPSFDDELSLFINGAEDNSEEQTHYLGEQTRPIIVESQPTYVTDVKSKVNYPSLLKILRKDIVGKHLIEPWDDAKSIMMDVIYNLGAKDTENQSVEGQYLPNNLDNGRTNIIVFKNYKKKYGSPITSLFDGSTVTQEQQMPTVTRYENDSSTEPLWLPQRYSQRQFPIIYFSTTDEVLKRKIPAYIDRTDEIMSFSPPLSYRSLKANTMESPITLLNEVMDDNRPLHFLPSPKTQSRFRFIGPDTVASPTRHDKFTTPNFSFLDLLQQVNPSFYSDANINNIAKQKYSSYYPQAYNYMTDYNDFQPRSYRSLSLPYSAREEHNYSPVQTHYYAAKPRIGSSYSSLNEPSNLFREDTMQMNFQYPLRHFNDNTDERRFRSRDSFSSPRMNFPFYQNLQYSSNYPSYNQPTYSYNGFYDMDTHTTHVHAKHPIEYF